MQKRCARGRGRTGGGVCRLFEASVATLLLACWRCAGSSDNPVPTHWQQAPVSTPINLDFLKMLRNESTYNRHATPTQYLGYPTNVSMSMYIEGMSSFSAQNMEFHVDIYFQQEWIDPRLSHKSGVRMLIRDKDILNMMWHPDTYFANARTAKFQTVTDDNFLIWIYQNGTVFYDCRISLSIMCMMDLSQYPLDGQMCDLRILSYAYDDSQLVLKWSERIKPVDQNKLIRMPDMHLLNIATGTCGGVYATGVWSCKNATFVVQREIMHHILQTYLPTGLIVVISWLSFWLDVDSAPARVSLSITTLLTISTQANAVKLSLPEVSYMKAVDVWMGTCMAFVFGVMIEFTVCHFARMRMEEAAVAVSPKKSSGGKKKSLASPTSGSSNGFGIGPSVLQATGGAFGAIFSARDQSSVQAQVVMEETESMLSDNGPMHPDAIIDYGVATPRKRSVNLSASPFGPRKGGRRQSGLTPRLFQQRMTNKAEKWTSAIRRLQGRKAARSIDQKCRIIFPSAFIVFNIVYWTYYLVICRLFLNVQLHLQ